MKTGSTDFAVQKRGITAKAVSFNLPIPPSLNNCFPTNASGHRYPSAEYQAWRKEAGFLLNTQRIPTFTMPVCVTLTLKEPKRCSDVDNRIKPALDLLVTHRILQGDDNRFVRRVTAQWSGDVDSMRVEIEAAADWIQRCGAGTQVA